MNDIIPVDLQNFVGMIPAGHMLVEYEAGSDPLDGLVLYGFDEVGFGGFKNPAWAFVNQDLGDF
jgi:hypothetical protein